MTSMTSRTDPEPAPGADLVSTGIADLYRFPSVDPDDLRGSVVTSGLKQQ
jgi:hypothetical protein